MSISDKIDAEVADSNGVREKRAYTRREREEEVMPRTRMQPVVQQRSADEVAPMVEAPPRRERPTNRKPFGAHEQSLAYPARPGYRRYWFNDIPGRIARAHEAGYAHVIGADGSNVSRVVGKNEGGTALTGYLMEIPQDWYDEDMAVQAEEREQKMAAIKRGQHEGLENRYVPQQGISIGSKR